MQTGKIAYLLISLTFLCASPLQGGPPRAFRSCAGLLKRAKAAIRYRRILARRDVGVVPEYFESGALVLGIDGSTVAFKIHEIILSNLPKGVFPIFLYSSRDPDSSFYADEIRDRFRSVGSVFFDVPFTPSVFARDYVPEVMVDFDGQAYFVPFENKSIHSPVAQVFIVPNKLLTPDRGVPDEELFEFRLAKLFGWPPTHSKGIVLQGGNLQIGTERDLWLTERVVWENRLLAADDELESQLKAALGVSSVHWLRELPGDRSGHIDTYLKILPGKKALLSKSKCQGQQAVFDEAAEFLRSRRYRITTIENFIPPGRDAASCSAAHSYVAALTLNDTAFVPAFGDPMQDAEAIETYRQVGFKRVVPVPAGGLAAQSAGLHCVGHGIPALIDLAGDF